MTQCPAARPAHHEPSEKLRVMLIDDSAVIRRVVGHVLDEEPDLEVVGTATNGQEALERVAGLDPHVVVLDVEMPVMDGLSTLRALRPRFPALPVIMFSTLTTRCAAATLDALAHGASDYAAKPGSTGSLADTMEAVRTDLAPLVRSWGEVGRRRATAGPPPTTRRPASPPTAAPATTRQDATRRRPPVEVVVIGSSAGGPNALAELIPQFPATFPVPMLLTQHMPESFTQLLASRLDARSQLTVVEGEPGMPVRPGHLYVARGGAHMIMARAGGQVVIDFDHGPPENYCRPAVDVMFRSAARTWGAGVLGIVLTGMGRDGVNGSRAIVEHGGTVLTQDEDSSLVWGMPGAVAEAGLSEENLPLDHIAAAVSRRLDLVAAG